MVDINLPNFITIGLIAAIFAALVRFISNATGFSIPFIS